jgi:hypothetical protein
MDCWDTALWVVAAYVAAMVLVRFMLARREQAIKELRERAAAEPRPPVNAAPADAETIPVAK